MWKYQNTDELCHYGVLGQKWGVRKDYSKGGIIKKKTKIRKITPSYKDIKYDNKNYKYISINDEDHKKWDKYLSESYLKFLGKGTYDVGYMTTKDLRIAGKIDLGKEYTNLLLDKKFKNQVLHDTDYANSELYRTKTKDPSINASRNITMRTETGKRIVNKLLNKKYDGVYDVHGTNVAKNPLIIFNPDKNLKRTKFDTYLSSASYKHLKDKGWTDKQINNFIFKKEIKRLLMK